MPIIKIIHNMTQGPPNPGFMQEKVQKGDFLKKPSRELKFFCCFRFLWISRRSGTLNWKWLVFLLSKILYKKCDKATCWVHRWKQQYVFKRRIYQCHIFFHFCNMNFYVKSTYSSDKLLTWKIYTIKQTCFQKRFSSSMGSLSMKILPFNNFATKLLSDLSIEDCFSYENIVYQYLYHQTC